MVDGRGLRRRRARDLGLLLAFHMTGVEANRFRPSILEHPRATMASRRSRPTVSDGGIREGNRGKTDDQCGTGVVHFVLSDRDHRSRHHEFNGT